MLISTLTGALWLMHGQWKLDLLLLAIALPSIMDMDTPSFS